MHCTGTTEIHSINGDVALGLLNVITLTPSDSSTSMVLTYEEPPSSQLEPILPKLKVVASLPLTDT